MPSSGDHRKAAPEDLAELPLTVMRELDIASASGVARRGDRVFVIGDELHELAIYRLSRPDEPSERRPVLTERAGAGKPDVECLTLLPPFEEAPHGCLLGLGSGSEPDRDRGFAWPLAPDGDLQGEPTELDLGPLWERLREHAGALNVEGAAPVRDALWIFNRGNAANGRNLVAEIPLDDVVESIRGDQRLDRCEFRAVRAYDLGDLEGVPLAFSDATPIADELVVFTASAEEEGDAGPDGAVRGSVVGTLDASGEVRRLRTIDRRWKVEGVYASIDSGVVDLMFVCDQDDPDTPSPLLVASMPVDARWDS